MNKTEYLLVCLAEECAEIQQAVDKALRFGLDVGFQEVKQQMLKIYLENG